MIRMEGMYDYTVIIDASDREGALTCISDIEKKKLTQSNVQIILLESKIENQQGNSQLIAVLNNTLDKVEGKYFFFLHSEDRLEKTFFPRLEEILISCQDEIDVVRLLDVNGKNNTWLNEHFSKICNLWDNYQIRVDDITKFVFRYDAYIKFEQCGEKSLYDIFQTYIYANIQKRMKIANLDRAIIRCPQEEEISKYELLEYIDWNTHLAQRSYDSCLEQYNLLNELFTVAAVMDDSLIAYKRTLEYIDDLLIIDTIGMGSLPLILWVLQKKYQKKLEVIPFGDDGIIRVGEYNVANMSYLAVTIQFLYIKLGKLYIEGNISVPTVFEDICEFCVLHNGNKTECTLEDCGMDLHIGKHKFESKKVFRVEVDLDEKENTIEFFNVLNGHYCKYGKINAMRFSPIADILRNQYCIRDDYAIYIQGNQIYCKKICDSEKEVYEKKFQEQLQDLYLPEASDAIKLRQKYFEKLKEKKNPIWLFIDRVDRADDNAEVFYRYVKKYDQIDSYFIIQKDTEDYIRLQELGGILPLNSEEHLLSVLMADYILSSQANGLIENPFRENSEYFRDLYHQPKIIFLQHGVTKDDQHRTFNRFNTNFTGFITSNILEKQSILDNKYFYDHRQIWLTGMPRFDRLYNKDSKIVLIMPSWRMRLMKQTWDEDSQSMIWKVKDNFITSSYVARYRSLLNNQRLREACARYGYRIAFMPHALMEPYIEHFITPESDCLYWNKSKSYRDAFAEGSIMITDYSSVAFDFAFLKKPIVYYQFDRELFFKSHTYDKGYFDYDRDGFGEVVFEESELVSVIIRYIESECKLMEPYKERMNKAFAYSDHKACERIFKRMQEEP